MFAPEKSGAINKKATEVAADLEIGIRPAVRMALAPVRRKPCSGCLILDVRERSKYLALEREHRWCSV